MAKKLEYSPQAILYRHRYTDNGVTIWIGTDPADSPEKTPTYFSWANVPGGWEKRTPWTAGLVLEGDDRKDTLVNNAVGGYSGWPGAIPLPSRPPGRPKKEVPEGKRPVSVSTSLERDELFEIMRQASGSHKTVSEWVAEVLREKLVTL